MRRIGNCYDNAAMEGFRAILIGECAFKQFKTKADAKTTSLNLSRFVTLARCYIQLWATKVQRNLSNLSDINRVH